MNTKQKQLNDLFEANNTTIVSNGELQDMEELYAYSFEEFSNELENDMAQFIPETALMFQYV